MIGQIGPPESEFTPVSSVDAVDGLIGTRLGEMLVQFASMHTKVAFIGTRGDGAFGPLLA